MSNISNQHINLIGYPDQPVIIQHLSQKRGLRVRFILERFDSNNGEVSRQSEQGIESQMFESYTGEVVKYIGSFEDTKPGQYLGYVLIEDSECGNEVVPLNINILTRELDLISSECVTYGEMLITLYRQLMMFKYKMTLEDGECYKIYNNSDIIIPFYAIDTSKLKQPKGCNKMDCQDQNIFATNATVIDTKCNDSNGFFIGSYPMLVTDKDGKSNNINISDKKSSYIVFEKGFLEEGRYTIYGETIYQDQKIHTNSITLTINSYGESSIS